MPTSCNLLLAHIAATFMVGSVFSQERLPGNVPSTFGEHSFKATNDQTLRYNLFEPKDVPAGKTLPLVVCLHGAYERGPMYLDYILPYFTTSCCIPERVDTLTRAGLEELQKMVSIKAMITALTLPQDKAIAAYARQLAGEPAIQWEVLSRELRTMIDSSDRRVELADLTSISAASLNRLIDMFKPTPAPAASADTQDSALLAS